MKSPIATVATFIVLGCSGAGARPSAFPVVFVARVDEAPLAGVRVTLAGREAGATGDDGRLALLVHGTEGLALRVAVACPEGYRGSADRAPLVLRRVQRLDDPDTLRPLVIALECEPRERVAMLLVRTGVGDIPVMIDGTERARTDGDGLAHVELHVAPGTRFEAVLWTQGQPDLLPRNPTRAFTLGETDDLFVFDQRLARAEAPRVIHRPAASRPVALPQRIR